MKKTALIVALLLCVVGGCFADDSSEDEVNSLGIKTCFHCNSTAYKPCETIKRTPHVPANLTCKIPDSGHCFYGYSTGEWNEPLFLNRNHNTSIILQRAVETLPSEAAPQSPTLINTFFATLANQIRELERERTVGTASARQITATAAQWQSFHVSSSSSLRCSSRECSWSETFCRKVHEQDGLVESLQ
jgi:hypothetical protein